MRFLAIEGADGVSHLIDLNLYDGIEATTKDWVDGHCVVRLFQRQYVSGSPIEVRAIESVKPLSYMQKHIAEAARSG